MARDRFDEPNIGWYIAYSGLSLLGLIFGDLVTWRMARKPIGGDLPSLPTSSGVPIVDPKWHAIYSAIGVGGLIIIGGCTTLFAMVLLKAKNSTEKVVEGARREHSVLLGQTQQGVDE
ncbi:hypothetical protein APSETT444_003178 [Aspergillus pseudonomiae]